MIPCCRGAMQSQYLIHVVLDDLPTVAIELFKGQLFQGFIFCNGALYRLPDDFVGIAEGYVLAYQIVRQVGEFSGNAGRMTPEGEEARTVLDRTVRTAAGMLACKIPVLRARPVRPKGIAKTAARMGPPNKRTILAVTTSKVS